MKPRYIPSRDLPVFRSPRAQRHVVGWLVLRAMLPGFLAWFIGFFVALWVMKKINPALDVDNFTVILAAAALSAPALAVVSGIGFGFYVRYLVRYRTRRRGREVALRQVLRPTDNRPSAWRRMWLTFYGVRREEINMAQWLWR